jgi:hypothetical protein
MNKKLLLIALFTIIVLGAFYGISEWFREHDSTAKLKADYTVLATELFDAYEENEEEANAKYLEKVIKVTGEVVEIDKEEDISKVILASNDLMFGVICVFDGKDEITTAPEIGSTVTLKGICSGKAMDVVLNRCALIE